VWHPADRQPRGINPAELPTQLILRSGAGFLNAPPPKSTHPPTPLGFVPRIG
jgi:hypothetical protein